MANEGGHLKGSTRASFHSGSIAEGPSENGGKGEPRTNQVTRPAGAGLSKEVLMESDKGIEGRFLPEAAARAMAASYRSAVEGVASRWGISEEEALDAVHDVLVNLLEALARSPGRLHIENWSAYIATAAGRRWQRSKGGRGRETLFSQLTSDEQQEIREEIPGPQPSASEDAAENEIERIAWAALDQLPFHQKGVIEMRLSGAPFEEIGRELAVTAACARRRYCDGIRALRTRFGISCRRIAESG